MTPSMRWTAFAVPFVITVAAIGVPNLLVRLSGSCTNVTNCAAVGYVLMPILLVVLPIAGFVAARYSTSMSGGLAAILTAAGLVVAVGVVTDPLRDAADLGPAELALDWLVFTALGFGVVALGFMIGRERRAGSARRRAQERVAAEVAALAARRDAGTMDADDFQREKAALLGSLQAPDQAPPDHRCGRCGKSLSPAWRGKCKHCGARYTDFPPVEHQPSSR